MRKTLLSLLLAGTMALFSPTSNAQTLPDKINPFKQPNQSKPLVWDTISTRAQRENLLKQNLAIDKTDTITYVPDKWVSGDFAMQTHLNFFGTQDNKIVFPDTNFIYDTTNFNKFNLPLYYVTRTASTGGHGMNAILIGDNPKNFSDWSFVEPQTDAIVQPGSQSIPSNSIVKINYISWFYEPSLNKNVANQRAIITFNIVNGQPSLTSYDTTRLVLDRTTDVVERLEDVASEFSLSQNYPNPFNPETKIKYNLQKESQVSLKVYDVLGREVQTLVDGTSPAGEYVVDFNASKLSSGVYFYRLKSGDFTETKKMVVNK